MMSLRLPRFITDHPLARSLADRRWPDFLTDSKWDKKTALALVGAAAAVALAMFMIARQTILAPATPGETSRIRSAIDGKTGEVFENFHVDDGVATPWKNPKTGENSLFPAEKCFWTKDGKAKMKPTFVLLNELVGKPGPTLCPDCGRPVVAHNPLPPVEILSSAGGSK